jgi:hypothetical protein
MLAIYGVIFWVILHIAAIQTIFTSGDPEFGLMFLGLLIAFDVAAFQGINKSMKT